MYVHKERQTLPSQQIHRSVNSHTYTACPRCLWVSTLKFQQEDNMQYSEIRNLFQKHCVI